jgi:hypothetical protein
MFIEFLAERGDSDSVSLCAGRYIMKPFGARRRR